MRYIKEKFRFMKEKGPETFSGGKKTVETQQNIAPATPADIIDGVNQEAHEGAVEVTADIFKTRLNELKSMNSEVFSLLEQSGILKNGLENTQQFEKFKKFIEYLNYLDGVTTKSILSNSETSQEVTASEKTKILKSYLELSQSTTTDKIWNKEFVAYKYLEAIFLDLHNMGYSIEKSGTDGYIVRDINTLKEVSSDKLGVYSELLEKENNSKSYMDTAIMANIMVRNPEYKDVMNQKQFVNKIFNDHGILSKRNDPDKTQYIEVDKELILEEINEKITSSESIETHRELTYLLDFVTNFTDGMHEKEFNQSNIYAKGFLEQKAYLDAFPGGKIPGLDPESKKSVPDQIGDMLKNHKFEAIALGLISWLMGYKKIGLGAIGIGFFGGAIADGVSATIDTADKKINGDEDKINPIEKGQLAPLLKMSEYQTKTDALFAYNYELSKGSMKQVEGQETLYRPDSEKVMEVKDLKRIINAITTKAIDADLRASDEEVITSLHTQLGEQFYKKEDISAFVELLRNSTIGESEDNTVLDYLSTDGKDILNKEYENIYPTGTSFDTEVNKIFNEKYSATTDRNEKRSINKMKDMLNDKFSTFNQIWEKIKESDFNLFTSNKQEIGNALNYLEKNAPELFPQLEPVFKAYENYLEVNSKIGDYEGIYDENSPVFIEKINTLMGNPGKVVLQKNIHAKIEELELLKIEDTGLLKYPEFSELNTRIDRLLGGLRKANNDIVTATPDKDELNGKQNPEKLFNTEAAVESLEGDINMRMKLINSSYEQLSTATELGAIYSALQGVDKSMPILSRYTNAIKGLAVSTTGLSEMQKVQQRVKNTLSEFETKKSEFEIKTKDQLTNYYTGNKEELDKVNGLSTTIEISDYIKTLSSTKEFLVEKGVILTSSQEQLIEELAANTAAIQQSLQSQKNQQPTQPSNQSNYDIAIEAYDKFALWLVDAKNVTLGNMMMIDDQVTTMINKVSNALGNIDATKEIDKARVLLQRTQTEFKLGNPDQQAEKTMKLAKSVFGQEFMKGEPTTELEEIKDAYDIKEAELKTLVQSHINKPLSSLNNDPDLMKDYYVELVDIKKIFNSMEGDVNTKLEAIKKVYINIVPIQNNTMLLNALQNDIAILPTNNAFKITIEGLMNQNKTIGEIENTLKQSIIAIKNHMMSQGKTQQEIQNAIKLQIQNINSSLKGYNDILDSDKLFN